MLPGEKFKSKNGVNFKLKKQLYNTYFLIGGGDALNSCHKQYYLQAIRLCKKNNPNFLYLPFALLKKFSIKKITQYTTLLSQLLHSLSPKISFQTIVEFLDKDQLEEAIKKSDIIYISGGDTNALIQYFKKVNFCRLLRKYYKKIIIANSAGVLALSNIGFSMSEGLKMYKGIGIIKSIIPIVHYKKRGYSNIKLSFLNSSAELVFLPENEAIVLRGEKFNSIPH